VSGTEILAILMLVAFFGLLLAGVPVALTLATTGFVFGVMGFGTGLFNLLPARIYGVVANYQWLAIPLFVFMGVMLEKSRLAEDLLDVVGHLAGGLKGGMALGIIGVGVLMGATTGIVGATVITLGLLTLPALLRRGYDPGVACGAICASGTLGQIIPPSLILILLSDILQLSVGTLFAAAVMPGLLIAALYCVYILILGVARPDLVPVVPQEERDELSRRELWLRFFKVVMPPLALVLSVLGSIIAGVAAPTEAASMGALGSILVTAFAGRMSLKVLRDTMQATTKITAMVMFILICAQVFSLAFRDRNQLHRGAAVPAGVREPERGHGLARDADLREPPDLVPHAAVRVGAVFPARGGAATSHHPPHVRWRDPVHRDTGTRRGTRVLLPADRAVAAQGNRVVRRRRSRRIGA